MIPWSRQHSLSGWATYLTQAAKEQPYPQAKGGGQVQADAHPATTKGDQTAVNTTTSDKAPDLEYPDVKPPDASSHLHGSF